MSIRESNLRTGEKDSLPATYFKTHRKKQYYLASPNRVTSEKQNDLSHFKFRSPLRQQEVQDYNRIKTELKRGIQIAKENISFSQSAQFVSNQQYNALNQQHKYETERLLIQIQRLHENMYEVQRNKNIQLQKLKQQYQKISYLNMSNVRQTNTSQIDMLQTQLRKTKQLLNDKTSQYQSLIIRQERQIKHLTNENSRLGSQLRTVVQKKNSQIQLVQKSTSQMVNKIRTQNQSKQQQFQQTHKKQINHFQRLIQHKQTKIQQYTHLNGIKEAQNDKLMSQIQEKRVQALQKLGQIQDESKQRYWKVKQSLQAQFSQVIVEINRNYEMKEHALQNQILKLRRFLVIKSQDRQKLIQLHEDRLQFANQLKRQVERENEELKRKLNEYKQQHMQQIQIMKVKMAGLHENDMSILVKSYQINIQRIISQGKQQQQTTARLRKNLYEQTNHRYQMRKKYSIQVSKLNAKVIKLRSGMSAMEVDVKEKIQNQRSMMLLSSRSLIKDVESKTQNCKFYEEQIRKLRQLFDLQQKEIQSTNLQVQQKIKIAEDQLSRLSKKIIDEKNHHQQTENQYKLIVEGKDSTIEKLKGQLESIQYPEFDNSKQLAMIEDLKDQLHEQKLQNGKLKDQCDLLQKKISFMKAEIDQYEIQHQVSQQQAKNQYRRISHHNMEQFRKFYQARIAVLQQDKIDLKQVLSSKQEKVTSLVQKYQQLEKAMKSTLANIKKRTELQNRVMQLGMDNNLVKNMAEIVRNNIEETV